MFLCKEIFFGKFSHSLCEYLDMFPTFKPPKWEYQFVRARWGGGVTRPKKNFFAFLHDSEDVLILIFESGKNCRNGRLPPP